MKKLLACVLAFGFCAFTTDAGLISKVKSGIKTGFKKVKSSKVGKAFKKNFTGDSETQQEILTHSSQLEELLVQVKKSVSSLNSEDIDGGKETLNSAISFTNSSVTLLGNVPTNTPLTILLLHKGLLLINATIAEISKLKKIIETEAKLSRTDSAIDVSDASNETNTTDGANAKLSRTDSAVDVSDISNETNATDGAKTTKVTQPVISDSEVQKLLNAYAELKMASDKYFRLYTNILQKMLTTVSSIKSSEVKSYTSELTTILKECKEDLSKLDINLASISMHIDNLKINGINTVSLNNSYQELLRLIAPMSKKLKESGARLMDSSANLADATMNAGANSLNKKIDKLGATVETGVNSLNEGLNTAVIAVDEKVNSLNEGINNAAETGVNSLNEGLNTAVIAVDEKVNSLNEGINNAAETGVNSLNEGLNTAVIAVDEKVNSLNEGINNAAETEANSLNEGINTLTNSVEENSQ